MIVDLSKLPKKFPDRESWLSEAAALILDELVMPAFWKETHRGAHKPPPVRISCGIPRRARGNGAHVLSEVFARRVSKGGVNEIFIAPSVDDPLVACTELTACLIQAVQDCENDNGKQALRHKIIRAVGLEGLVANPYSGNELRDVLSGYCELLGAYPHRALDYSLIPRQGIRQIKCQCLEPDCKAVWRMSVKWIQKANDELHCPVCQSGLTLARAPVGT